MKKKEKKNASQTKLPMLFLKKIGTRKCKKLDEIHDDDAKKKNERTSESLFFYIVIFFFFCFSNITFFIVAFSKWSTSISLLSVIYPKNVNFFFSSFFCRSASQSSFPYFEPAASPEVKLPIFFVVSIFSLGFFFFLFKLDFSQRFIVYVVTKRRDASMERTYS